MDLCSLKDIRPILEKNGFHFSRSKGQNFLIDSSVPRRIAEYSGIDRDCGVLEVGPGVGCLTRELTQRAEKVVAVELDKRLLSVLDETLAGIDNVEIISADVLKLDLETLVNEKLDGLRPCVCANLPYNITTPVLTKLIDTGLFTSLTVMVQREVARRMCARAGQSDYGAFSIYIRWHCEPEILFDVAPGCFYPAPKVTSSVIQLTKREVAPEPVDEALFFRVVRAAFSQRRKTLLNALSAAFGSSIPRERMGELIYSAGLEKNVRGEALDIGEFAVLSELIGGEL
ncbi:MAG: ribosomal RNA small subunit methyltransferase A [Oscillospiraceae bacterium]|nr:ribosomal RNA small subunit methyltransferase A [Oscillospiraceae bacterium]